MRPYSPGGTLNALAPAQKGSIPPTPSVHRLGRGLPGYLILFAPHAFVPQCQLHSREPPTPLVFFLISTHSTATPRIPLSSPALKPRSFGRRSTVERWDFTPTHEATYAPFTPSKSEQRSPPLYYRGCWHRVSRGFLLRYYHFQPVLTAGLLFPHDRSLQPEGLHPPRSVAPSGLRPLRMILDCSLP